MIPPTGDTTSLPYLVVPSLHRPAFTRHRPPVCRHLASCRAASTERVAALPPARAPAYGYSANALPRRPRRRCCLRCSHEEIHQGRFLCSVVAAASLHPSRRAAKKFPARLREVRRLRTESNLRPGSTDSSPPPVPDLESHERERGLQQTPRRMPAQVPAPSGHGCLDGGRRLLRKSTGCRSGIPRRASNGSSSASSCHCAEVHFLFSPIRVFS